MGACCGGMKTSNQHKSLPEKNKAAAAAANEQQLNNDGVAAKTTVSSENHEHQQVSNNQDEQLEVATKETSLEAGLPPALQQNGSAPEVIHSNHVDTEQAQQQAEPLKIEEPDLVVAAKASSVSAEVPLSAVSVEEPELIVAASVAEQVSCEPPSSGDDAGNDESVGIDTIQLRISEDGDLEKSTGDIKADAGVTLHEEKQVVFEQEVVSVVTVTNTEAAAPVAEDVITDAPAAVESEQQPIVTDAAPVAAEIKPTSDEDVEVAVPYQPEVTQQPDVVIENIPAQETLPEPAAAAPAVETETITVTNADEVISIEVASAVEPEEAHDVPAADVINDSVVAESSSTVLEATEVTEASEPQESVILTESAAVVTTDIVADDRTEEQQLPAEVNEPKLADEVHPEEAAVVPAAAEVETIPVATEDTSAVAVETVAVPEEQVPKNLDVLADETTVQVSAGVESEHVNAEQPSIEQQASTELSHEATLESNEVPRADVETVTPVAVDGIDKPSDESELAAQPVTVVEEFSITESDVPLAPVDEQPPTVIESSAVIAEAQPEVSESQEVTPVVAQTPETSSDLPSPPEDAEVAPVPVDIQQEPAAIITDEDDLLPPPPPPEDLAVELPAPPAVVDQEPASSTVNIDDQQASSLADSGVSQTASSPEELVSSPSGDESSTAANVSADETGDVTSSSSVQPSQDAPILSEA